MAAKKDKPPVERIASALEHIAAQLDRIAMSTHSTNMLLRSLTFVSSYYRPERGQNPDTYPRHLRVFPDHD